MTDGDVTTLLKRGQWINRVEGHPELSQGYASREEAVAEGSRLANEHGGAHRVEQADPEEERNAFGYDESDSDRLPEIDDSRDDE